MNDTHDFAIEEEETSEGLVSLAALQFDLRVMFANRPANRALADVLGRIGQRLGAVYAVAHARIGVHLLSEEWQKPGSPVETEGREFVNATLWESISTEQATCKRLPGDDQRTVVVTAPMYDQDAEPAGGAALVLRDCGKVHAVHVLAQLEGILGYISLLVTGSGTTRVAARRSLEPHRAATHPLRLCYAIVGDLEARYGFDTTAIGLVDGTDVEVTAITGLDEFRPANPGVRTLRAAMAECLDFGHPIVHLDAQDTDSEHSHRLHAQWSAELHGTPVASIPLLCMDQVVAIVSMSQGAGTRLSKEQVQIIAEELTGYAALVPLTRAAARSLREHARDSVREWMRTLFKRGGRRNLALLLTGLMTVLWLLFGTLDYSFTVPCSVKPTDRRTVSCPRAGVLTELLVHPGDRVHKGQLLASLDASDEFLRRSELVAEIESLDALIDNAIETRDSGTRRTHEAQKLSLLAQLAIVDAAIGQAQILAPQDGLILEGDLREQLGARLKMGDRMFEVARYDSASVSLKIPERMILAAHECLRAHFAPTAHPDVSYEISALRIAPSSKVVDGRNVFLGEATVPIDLGELPPGMEGTANIEVGGRSAWWVLTHRATDWLHLNFWL